MVDNKNKKKRKSCCCCNWWKRRKQQDEDDEESTIPANEPPTSHFEEIKEPLVPGSCIVIKGKVRSECKRFAINLLHVRDSRTDIAFHFNPRIASRYIVRNARINNTWGVEETTSIEKFQLSRNKTFEFQIVATETEFLVSLDGRHVCGFAYRVALEKINKLEAVDFELEGVEIMRKIKTYPSVDGFVELENIVRNQVETYPLSSSLSSIQDAYFTVPMRTKGDNESADIFDDDEETKKSVASVASQQLLKVPITATLPNGFKCDWQLEINGRVKILPSAFYINLQMGNSLWPHPTIPLHLNPRFYTSYGNHLFVRNSWMNGEWGTEERTAGFQFTPGKNFHIAIRKHPDHFAVWVDGSLAGEFKFRTPSDNIDTVFIHGDVQIFSILMKDHIDDKYFSKSREKLMVNNSL